MIKREAVDLIDSLFSYNSSSLCAVYKKRRSTVVEKILLMAKAAEGEISGTGLIMM
jgi:hypothetical protein